MIIGERMAEGASINDQELLELQATAESLVAFREKFLAAPNDVEAAPFHHRWSHLLLNSREHVAIMGFRESAKDQYIYQANIMHALTYPMYNRSYIVIISNNKTQASQKLKDITRQFQSVENSSLRFNVAKIIEDSGDAFQVQYLDGMQVRIEAYGKGAAVRGIVWGAKRPDIVILNDIQDVEDMESPITLEKDWHWFLSDIKFLGHSSRIFMIGNNMGPNCVIEKVFQHARELNFITERVPWITEDFKAAWPARFPYEYCMAERESYESIGEIDIWERERMCRAMAEESHPLKWDNMMFYNEAELDLSGMSIITMTDPGISEKADADPTVIITVGIAQDNKWYILDVDRRRRNPSEQINDIFRAVSRWRPVSVGIETVAYQESLAHFVEKEQKERGVYFNVVRVRSRGNKISKIRGRLQPLMRVGMLYAPKHAPWLEDFKAEVGMFPVAKHDDILDALSMIEDARAELLVPAFNSRTCVAADTPIPAHWPLWSSMVADPEGDAVIIFGTCSPEGNLTILDQIYARVTPEELYHKYKEMIGNRQVISLQVPMEMFKERRKTGQIRSTVYSGAGFKMVQSMCDYSVMLPVLSSYFTTHDGSRPKLQISPKCKRLLWELYNALEGELKSNDRKSIQALLLWLSSGPKWRDMRSQPLSSARNIKYPSADIP